MSDFTEAVGEQLAWLGSGVLALVVPAIAYAATAHGTLTPTRKSPARPGDDELRRSLGRMVRVQLAVALFGAGLLLTALALD